MDFAEFLLSVMKRVAAHQALHLSPQVNDEGVFEVTVLAIIEQSLAPLALVSENASDDELANFEKAITDFEKAFEEQEAENAANEVKVREILSRLTPEERELIDRPLPEDLPNESGEEGYTT
jgi:DNA-directed RNA polymerase sigma subunit (sigma70/sigma32)